jgi:hypothetical protein
MPRTPKAKTNDQRAGERGHVGGFDRRERAKDEDHDGDHHQAQGVDAAQHGGLKKPSVRSADKDLSGWGLNATAPAWHGLSRRRG